MSVAHIWLQVVSAKNGLTCNIIDFQPLKVSSYMNLEEMSFQCKGYK